MWAAVDDNMHTSRIISHITFLTAIFLPGAFTAELKPTPARTRTSPIPRYDAYASRVTTPPRFNPNPQRLFARQQSLDENRFCAYANGDGADPIYCPKDYTCTYLGPLSVAWGCCNARTCTNAPRTCFDEGDPQVSYCTTGGVLPIDCNSIFTSYLSCTGSKNKCATYIIKSDTLDPQNTVGPMSFACAASKTQILAYFTPVTNLNAAVTFADSGSSPSTPTSKSSSSSKENNNPNSNNSNNNDNNDNRRGLDTGAIIGIIIAVLGVIATIAVGLFPRQMTRCLTCGLRPKKEHSNEEIRKNFWLYLSGRGVAPASTVHIHYHNTPGDQQSLTQGGAPIGLSPVNTGWEQQEYWQGNQQYGGYAGGYGQHPPPAYQPGYAGQHHGTEYISPSQYAASTQSFQMQEQEQRQPFLELADTGKK